MEPLPAAVVAALTPKDVNIRFFDDRIEPIPYDEPTDLVGISVEVYTAKRAYQIASEYRKRGVPVVMGGFHPTLVPDEAAQYAESVVLGEAEDVWAQVIDDYRAGTPRKFYRGESRPLLHRSTPDRSIFAGKRYLPLGLIEAGRGCPFTCDFCAIQSYYKSSYNRRPVDDIVRELQTIKDSGRKLVFFVDDNIISNRPMALEMLRAIAPLKMRWVTQGSINMASDEELLVALRDAGCMGVLIGFESMNPNNLRMMGKQVNVSQGGYEQALAKLHRYGIRVYGTFVFGYDEDTPETFDAAAEFASANGLYLCGFNHLTPIPGTPLYTRLEQEGRLRYKKWWLDNDYSYNKLPFNPKKMTAEAVREHCLRARRKFYSIPNVLRRSMHPVNRSDFFMWRNFFPLNLMHRYEVDKRDHFPLGDPTWAGTLLEANR
jgi:radical SAM superfamily enzyme YgiQ (UPF0313 family)